MTTKEEKFLLELAKLLPNADATADPNAIGQTLGFSPHQTKMIVRMLGQSNLIKKYSPTEITLTPHGYEALQSL